MFTSFSAKTDLKVLSGEAIATSKSTEKQVNQSISFSQKEFEAITSNSEREGGTPGSAGLLQIRYFGNGQDLATLD